MPGKPAFQMYSGDWMKDPGVCACQLAAKGLWFQMIILMSQSPRYGYLLLPSGQPPSIEQLTIMVGGRSVDEVESLLGELDRNGVPSRTKDGVYYCRRMVREEAERKRVRESMQKKRGRLRKCDGDVTSKLQECDGRSSSSSSTSVKNKDSPPAREAEPSMIGQTAGELARRENQRERGPPDESYTSLDASPAVRDVFSRMLQRRWEMISADSRWKILRKIERHGEPALLAAAEECIRDGETALTTCFTIAARTAIRAGTKKGGSLEQREDGPARVRDGDDDKYAHLDPPAADNGRA